METLGATRDVLDSLATAAGPETRGRGSWPVADGAQQGFPGSSARLGCASRTATPPPPRPVHAATPPAAHLALADAEDAAAAAQAHARAPGLRGRAAEGEGAARGAQPPHRGQHQCGRPAPPARPQVQVAQRDEHGRRPRPARARPRPGRKRG